MAKTKEETLKVVEKNYYEVQKTQLDTFDEFTNLHKTFEKQEVALNKDHKSTLKSIEKEQKEITSDYKELTDRCNQRLEDHETQVETNKKASKDQLDKEHKEHASKETKAIKAIEKDIVSIKADFVKERDNAAKKLEQNREDVDKKVQSIQEKSAKDQASFEQKRNDLQLKYEEKIKSLEEKEATKIDKLKETADKKVASIEEDIKTKDEKAQKEKATKQSLYEEELAEIDEKISFEKAEFQEKHTNIKDSADKRIAVREKHLQRALNDNDSRSAKQHKKDIAQFRKEATRDLSLLEKNFTQQEKTSANYRNQFIKDHFEEIAELDRKFAEYKEDKLFDIDKLRIGLANDIENTKLEHEENRAKELNKFNENFAEVREKQESVFTSHQLDIKQEQHELQLLEIETSKTLELSEEKEKESIEQKEKERREAILHREHEEALSNNTYEESLVRLENELSVARLESARDITILEHEEQIKLHALQDKRHQSIKHLFHGYQQYIQPLFVGRMNQSKQYQEKEINNRLALALDFQEKIREKIEQDYQLLTSKIEEVHQEEASFLEQTIEETAGSLKEKLATYIEENEAEFLELNSKIEALSDFKDRKERKEIETELSQKEQEYEREKARMENELTQKVGVYQTLLADVNQRQEIALKDAKEILNNQLQVVQNAIDKAKETARIELEQSTNSVNQTEETMQHFDLQMASRNQRQTDAHNQFLKAKVEQEKVSIQDANESFDRSKEMLQKDMEQKISELSIDRNGSIETNRLNIDQEESQFEQFRQTISDAIDAIKSKSNDSIADENTSFTQQKNALQSELNIELNNIKNTLQTQVTDYNQTMDDIKKREQQESSRYDSENKRIKKDKEERLKVVLNTIQSELNQNIQSI